LVWQESISGCFGDCKICPLAQSILQQALATLNDENNTLGPVTTKATQLREAATGWVTVIDSLIGDYQYP
jgi:hypothetical protein